MKSNNKNTFKIKFFPFSPGIPWKFRNNKFLVPEINKENWDKLLDNKDIVILAYGGLLESFYSLFVAEVINKIEINKNIFWAGKKEFVPLINGNGLSKYNENIKNISKRYSVPLFVDKLNYAYFNCLNNYIITKNIMMSWDYENKDPVLKQLFDNIMIEWDNKFIPKINHFDYKEYESWKNKSRFNDKEKFILILLDETNYSESNISCLNWESFDILNLAGMLKRLNINLVVYSKKPINSYSSTNLYQINNELPIIIPLIERSWMLLAKEIDYLMIALAIAPNTQIAFDSNIKKSKAFDIYKNADFLNAENIIYSSKNLNAGEIYMIANE